VLPRDARTPGTGAEADPTLRAGREAAEVGAEGAAPGSEARPAPTEAARIRPVEGTIVVVDPEGGRHPAESGRFEISIWQAEERVKIGVTVVEGRWSAALPSATAFDVAAAHLGGRMTCLTWDAIPVPDEGVVALEAWWPRPSVLVVRDAATGREMTTLTVVRGTRFDDSRVHPSEGWVSRIAERDARSPVTLPEVDGYMTWFVRAPGHAWGRASVDHRRGGVREVLLVPGGDLDVTLAGALPPAETWLRVSRADALGRVRREPAAEFHCASLTPIRVEGLPAADYHVVVARGRAHDPEAPLAAGRVVVEAGRLASLHLELDAASLEPDPPGVSMAGTLRLPPDAADAEVWLQFGRPQDDGWVAFAPSTPVGSMLRPAADEPGAFTWFRGPIEPGTWVVAVRPFGVYREVLVGPAGRDDVDLEIEELSTLELHLEDARTGEPIPEAYVRYVRAEWEANGGHADYLSRDAATPHRVVRTPPGTIAVEASSMEHRERREEVVLRSGTTRHAMRLEPAEQVVVQFREGGAVVPIDEIGSVGLRRIGDDEPHETMYYDRPGQTIRLHAPEPGRYRLEVEPPDGFAPVPPREIQLARHEELEVVVELARGR
jgi:hypothetical protein